MPQPTLFPVSTTMINAEFLNQYFIPQHYCDKTSEILPALTITFVGRFFLFPFFVFSN